MLRQLPTFSVWLHGRQPLHRRWCAAVSEDAAARPAQESPEEAHSRPYSRLRQMALLVAYHGDKYYGMEMLRCVGGFFVISHSCVGQDSYG